MYTEYFKEIFETSKTIIIPGLGSFSKASASDSKISFNPYLKFNDGFLASFIAKKQGISIDEADKNIAENIEKINTALTQKGEAVVLGLGTLKKSADGKIEFLTGDVSIASPTIQVPEVKPKIEPVAVKVEKITEEIKNEERKPSVEPIVPPVEKTVVPPVQPQPKQEPQKEEPKVVTEINTNSKEKELKTVAPQLTQVHPQQKDTGKQQKQQPKAPKEKKERKKRKFPIWLMLLLALLVGGGVFTALKWDMVKSWFVAEQAKNEIPDAKDAERKNEKDSTEASANNTVVEQQNVDTIVAEQETTTENTVEPEQKNETEKAPVQTTPVVAQGNFHVIVNCYSVQENATKMVEKLTAEGHQAINLGLRGQYYVVSAGSFSTADEANSKLQTIKNTYPKAWVYNGL